jgi:hypothetical protein
LVNSVQAYIINIRKYNIITSDKIGGEPSFIFPRNQFDQSTAILTLTHNNTCRT